MKNGRRKEIPQPFQGHTPTLRSERYEISRRIRNTFLLFGHGKASDGSAAFGKLPIRSARNFAHSFNSCHLRISKIYHIFPQKSILFFPLFWYTMDTDQPEGDKTMVWSLEEAISYYQSLGAPQDQSALVGLLKEIQKESGGAIPKAMLGSVAAAFGVKESLLLALIRRLPSLRLADSHVLEICAGPNCSKHAALAALGENLQSSGVAVKFVPCMRQCGKGPNIKWDGTLYNGADEALLKNLGNL